MFEVFVELTTPSSLAPPPNPHVNNPFPPTLERPRKETPTARFPNTNDEGASPARSTSTSYSDVLNTLMTVDSFSGSDESDNEVFGHFAQVEEV
jgi:hypothetical protein